MVADPEGLLVADDGSQPVRASCPRCGYDLRGLVATWEDRCPLKGVCSECGLSLRWAEVLMPEKFEPRWCVEFAPGWRALPRAAWRTLIRSFWPWGLWGRLTMSLRIRWRRLAAYICLLMVPLVFGYLAVQSVAAIRVRFVKEQDMARMRQVTQRLITRAQQRLRDGGADARIRVLLQQEIQECQQYLQQRYTISDSYWDAVIEAVLHPRRSFSSGTITDANGISPYPAPCDLHSLLDASAPNRWGSRSLGERLTRALWYVMTFGWIFLILPLGFLLLPISRRRAKVRFGHIVRVACYGLFIAVLIVFAAQLLVALGYAWPGSQRACDNTIAFVTFLPSLVLLAAWWAVAIKRYLRMPHGPLVVLSLGAISFLLWLGMMWYVWPDMALVLLDMYEAGLGL
jgi:hypothetical protein